MRTAVMTDTNSGITDQEAEELGIFLLPMPIVIDGEIRYEGKDLTQEEFYKNLTEGKNISTSQPSPGDVMELWERILESGYDELVHIPMSSGLSNSCATAVGLSAEYEGKVVIIDNHRISIPMRESVLEAVELANSGVSAVKIKAELEAKSYDTSIYIAVDTLEFLKKGGRITPAAAIVGEALHIKPILTIQGERLDAFAKVRGMKKCKKVMLEALHKDIKMKFADIASGKLVVGLAGTGLNDAEIAEWKCALEETFPQANIYYNPLALSIGTHTGPGAVGIAFCIRR